MHFFAYTKWMINHTLYLHFFNELIIIIPMGSQVYILLPPLLLLFSYVFNIITISIIGIMVSSFEKKYFLLLYYYELLHVNQLLMSNPFHYFLTF